MFLKHVGDFLTNLGGASKFLGACEEGRRCFLVRILKGRGFLG